MKATMYWLPRILAILYTLFISMFALDVFDKPDWILALVMHLIPSFILIILTGIAWKSERIGGYLFLLTGLGMGIFFHSVALAVPVFVIGIFFLANRYRM
jgi:hypothetical protein